jgi:glycolate oxidase FAD binding subunit
VAGYDFPKLLTGSSGSLGMITELTFKVRPRPESTAVAFIQVHTAQELDDYLTRLNTSMTRPTAIEVLCRKAAQGLTQKLGMALSNYTVALFFDESAKAVNWQLDQLKKEAPAGSEINILKDEPAKIEQDELTERLAGAGSKLVARAVVAPSRLVQLIEKAAGPWNIQAHAGQGIATLIPAHGVNEIEALESVSQLRKVVGSIGGTVTMAVCPNEWKPAIDVWGPWRPDWDLMIGVKRALDPQSLFNPGVLPGSL